LSDEYVHGNFGGKMRSWYEGFPSGCIYSLVDFHMIFYENFKETYPSLLLVKYCCQHVQGFIQYLESVYGDEELMDEELQEPCLKFLSNSMRKNQILVAMQFRKISSQPCLP
jgi:hypothetical protein